MFGLLFGGRRRSPALFYLRLGMLAVLLLATFVLHFSTTDLVALRIARIVIVVLILLGARLAGGQIGRPWRERRSSRLRLDATAGETPQPATDEHTKHPPR
ncbi:MAG: hypothetical protein WAU69_02345 [Solirubrobacteraceae bacterium]